MCPQAAILSYCRTCRSTLRKVAIGNQGTNFCPCSAFDGDSYAGGRRPSCLHFSVARISLKRLRGIGSSRRGPFPRIQDMSPPEISPSIVVRLCLCRGVTPSGGPESVSCSLRGHYPTRLRRWSFSDRDNPKEGIYLVSIASWRLFYQNPSLLQSATTSVPDLTFRT